RAPSAPHAAPGHAAGDVDRLQGSGDPLGDVRASPRAARGALGARAHEQHSRNATSGSLRTVRAAVSSRGGPRRHHGDLHRDPRAGARGHDRRAADRSLRAAARAGGEHSPYTAGGRRATRARGRGRRMSEQMQDEAHAEAQEQIRNIVEAALLAAGRPLSLAELAQLFEEGQRPDAAALRIALEQLEESYATRALEVKQTAAGYRLQVRSRYSAVIGRLWPERPQRYSRALLETLALIAYRQPITRAEIEAVRGVIVNPNIVKTLLERGWIRVVGHRELPGRPELLGTTREFLDYFGLRGLDELPPLAELRSFGELDAQLPALAQIPLADAPASDSPAVSPEAGEAGSEEADSTAPSGVGIEERAALEGAADSDETSAMVAASRGTDA